MSETELLNAVVDLCQLLRLLVHHDRPARTEHGWRTPIQGTKGFPDVVIAGAGGLLFAELKSETGRLDPGQQRWRDVLQQAGLAWRLWRPQQWLTGEIQDELKALAKGGGRG